MFSCNKEAEIICSNDNYLKDDEGSKLVIPVDEGTKAYYGENGNFFWENRGKSVAEVLTMISASNNIVNWKSGQPYTYSEVVKVTDKKANLVSRSSLNFNSVKKGDKVVCISPFASINGSSISSSNSCIEVQLPMPKVFKNTNNPNNLSAYTYMYAQSTVEEVNGNNFTANNTTFKSIPAMLQVEFNNNEAEKHVSKIVLKALSGDNTSTKIFPDKLIFKATAGDVKISEPEIKENYSDSLVIEVDDCVVKPNTTQKFYAYVFPLTNSADFNCTKIKIDVYTKDVKDDCSYNILSETKDISSIKNDKFCGGLYYIFNVDAANTVSTKELMPYKEYLFSCIDKGISPINIAPYKFNRNNIGNDFSYDLNERNYSSNYPEYTYFIRPNSFVYECDNNNNYLSLSIDYYERKTNELEDAVQKGLSLINKDMTELEKVLTIFNWVCNTIVYDGASMTSFEENTIANRVTTALIEERAVCLGYSKAFLYFMKRLGIECEIITGYVGREYHAWNKVKVNGKWLLIDATWGGSNRSKTNQDEWGFAYKHFLRYDSFSDREVKTPESNSHDNVDRSEVYKNAFWNTQTRSDGRVVIGDIVVIDHVAYYTTGENIYKHSLKENELSGKGEWLKNTMLRDACLQAYQGFLYYTTQSGIYRLNPKTKQEIQVFSSSTAPTNLRVAKGTMYFKVNGLSREMAVPYNY
jgi:Uncharacterized protein involved in cytokinesis, contains TGc (transglutaminase/protease-like) domain